MVKGLQKFKEHFSGYTNAFVIIGGIACDTLMREADLQFRATQDIDMVLIAEATSAEFFRRFWDFIKAGKYEVKQKAASGAAFYRFVKPAEADFPKFIELFSTATVDVAEGQEIVPIPVGEDISSLSAILMDGAYYAFVRQHIRIVQDLPVLAAHALIPLKAKAWTDLQLRKTQGQKVDDRDILKHRNDVFRLTLLLDETGITLVEPIKTDLKSFLSNFGGGSNQWPSILASLESTGAGGIEPAEILQQLHRYFGLI